MKMIGVIFSNVFDHALGDLTKHRTLASLPFGSRYRLIDFVLSNMSNSHIDHIGVITKYNYQSLMDHLGSCEEWDLNRKNGRVEIIPPFSNGPGEIYQGKLQALQGALTFLKRAKGQYVLLSSSNVICNIDYEEIFREHLNSKEKVTIVCHRQTPKSENDRKDLVLCHKDNKVTDIMINHTYTEDNLIGMGMYIIDKNFLIDVIDDCVSHGLYDLEKDFLQKYFLHKGLNINVYEFKNSVLTIDDVPSYFRCNELLLNADIRNDIFNLQNPIYTKVRDEIPTFYGSESCVDNSLLADGCRILGKVENSILFRDVTIEEGASVKNCIIMQGSVVKKDAKIEACIIDKDVVITENRTLVGSELSPVIVLKGQTI